MPLGDSPVDSKPKTPLKKAIAFISPLLVVSAIFHGLAMLLPVPEPEEIVEEEVELPEPIRVSELPELEIPAPAPEPAPVFAPRPAPAAPPVVQPAPVVQQQPIVVAPQAPVVPVQPQPVAPPQPDPDLPLPDPGGTPDPAGPQSNEPTGSSSVVRNYSADDRNNSLNYLTAFINLLDSGIYIGEDLNDYKELKDGVLAFSLPAEDNCFAEAASVDATSVMLPTSLGVIVSNDGGDGLARNIVIVGSTGYKEANDLISGSLVEDTAYDLVDAWLKTAVPEGLPFDAANESLSYLIWNVEVTFTEHSCPDPAV